MASFIFNAPGLPKTQEELARLRRITDAMAVRPISTPHNIGEGLNAIGQALMYRGMLDDLNSASANIAKQQAGLGLPPLGGGGATPAPAPTSAPTPIVPPSANATAGAALSGTPLADQPAPLSGGMPPQSAGPDFGKAIASIESGGAKDPYSLTGPATRTGDRALGKYQVMASNVPEWTKAALGQAMTPQQFLASPEAQDAVFKHQFGQYVAKYGPEGAAKAWFAGPGGMNNPNASDSLGTTVASYARKFMNALGPTSANAAEVSPATAQLFSPDASTAQPLQPVVANAGSPPPEMGVLPYAPDAGPMPPMPANVPLPPMRPDAAPATFDQRFGAMQPPTLAQTPAPVQVASLGGGVPASAPASPRQQIAQLLQSPPTGQFTPGALPNVTNVPTRTLDLAPGGARDAVARALMGQGGAPAAPTPITPQAAPTTAASPANAAQLDWARKVLQSPYASKTQQALAGEILKQAMTVDKPTNDIINYRQAVSQGYKGSFLDYQTAIRQAARQQVNIDQRAESSFEQNYGKQLAGEAADIVTLGDKAATNLQKSTLLSRLLTQAETGKLTPATSTMGAWLQAAGINPSVVGIDPSLPATAQSISGLANEMILGKIGKGGFPANNFSEQDRKFLLSTIPQLGDTPGAARLKLEVSRRLDQLAIAKADAWAQARDQHKSFDQFQSEWRRTMGGKDLFADLAGQVGQPGQQKGAAPGQPSIDDLIKKYGPQ